MGWIQANRRRRCSASSAGSPRRRAGPRARRAAHLLRQGAQLVVQGSGDPVLEAAFPSPRREPGPGRGCAPPTTRRWRTASSPAASSSCPRASSLRSDPALRPALRHAAGGAPRRRPGRHGGRCRRRGAARGLLSPASPSMPLRRLRLEAAIERAVRPCPARVVAAPGCARAGWRRTERFGCRLTSRPTGVSSAGVTFTVDDGGTGEPCSVVCAGGRGFPTVRRCMSSRAGTTPDPTGPMAGRLSRRTSGPSEFA